MAGPHLRLDHCLADEALGHGLAQKGEEELLLVRVRVALVAAGLGGRREVEVDLQARLPGLRPALGIVQEPGLRRQVVEVVPFGLLGFIRLRPVCFVSDVWNLPHAPVGIKVDLAVPYELCGGQALRDTTV